MVTVMAAATAMVTAAGTTAVGTPSATNDKAAAARRVVFSIDVTSSLAQKRAFGFRNGEVLSLAHGAVLGGLA
ncbi:hypothetical protein AUC69_04050 [Methyloceanibacter superfactus]|uniref:Uncharacterized protein n=1 Tax=Methyloceanibacter superfactus TaxID=1774969 RepID=A0A1E3VJQ7_9HYPH|nr:hypothetical protein AUC69_04050 [Methyloceanibacter superfactus]